ncbi:MAG TPA: 4Fe-4S binding protein [Anaerolineae bacterium]|jgi:Pyruvate/2-oxoacid:ferredoxin oxidoreductase delta subunit|nr:4Fe-4S binding protein [Anaerolineae bacterium]
MAKKSTRKAEIDQNRCDRSLGCPASRVCPTKAIVSETQTDHIFAFFGPRPTYSVDEDLCVGCGVCTSRCPMGAISMR